MGLEDTFQFLATVGGLTKTTCFALASGGHWLLGILQMCPPKFHVLELNPQIHMIMGGGVFEMQLGLEEVIRVGSPG